LQRFPHEVDAYLDERFGGRGLVMAAWGRLRYAMRSPTSERVVYGRDGWLFLTDNRALEESSGVLVRPERVSAVAALLAQMNGRMSADGRRFITAIMPNKHTIYPQYLPDWAARRGLRTEYDLFLSAANLAGLDTVDLRPPLRALSSREPVYYRTDTHWNKLGALTAYNAIVRALGRSDWAMAVDRVLGIPVAWKGGDLARFLAVETWLSDQDRALAIEDPENRAVEWGDHTQRSFDVAGKGDGGTLLIVGDSFSRNFMRPYFAQHVSRLVWVHHMSCRFDWSVIDRFDPDTVLFLMNERLLTGCAGNRPSGMPDAVN
jgi:hypothetical protein